LSKNTDTLVAELSNQREAVREAAIARLTIVGARAVDRLIELAASSGPSIGRVAALRTLEAIGDRRALPTALTLISDPDPEIAVAAVGVARAFVKGRHGVQAVDRLSAIAVDRSRPAALRAAAVHALRDLGEPTIAPLLKQVGDDPAIRLSELDAMRATVDASAKAPLQALLRLVEDIRQREEAAPASTRAAWTEVRGAAHLALARRGSRIALYDLREAIERAKSPQPAAFLSALTLIGDASCLEPIATAYAHAADLWWKKQLADAFHAIVKRERITRRHAVMRKIRTKGLGIGG
jgi:HEAT repeat protein